MPEKKIAFNEQCRIGLEKRQGCTRAICPHYQGIAFNHCWDCTRREDPSEPAYPNIGGSPVIYSDTIVTQEEGCLVLTYPRTPKPQEVPKQDEVSPPEETSRTEETRPDDLEDPPPPSEVSPPEDPHPDERDIGSKPTKYLSGDELADLTKAERDALNTKYEVFLI